MAVISGVLNYQPNAAFLNQNLMIESADGQNDLSVRNVAAAYNTCVQAGKLGGAPISIDGDTAIVDGHLYIVMYRIIS